MVDKIVELDNNMNYLILEEQTLDNNKYYLGMKLDKNDDPINEYLFFKEEKDNKEIYLTPILDEGLKGILLTTFTANFIDMAYSK